MEYYWNNENKLIDYFVFHIMFQNNIEVDSYFNIKGNKRDCI